MTKESYARNREHTKAAKLAHARDLHYKHQLAYYYRNRETILARKQQQRLETQAASNTSNN